MKKLVLFLLSGVVLFGGQLQQATPLMAKFEGATKIQYIEANPVQITLKVPVELDALPTGKVYKDQIIGSGYKLDCTIRGNREEVGKYVVSKEITPGIKTIIVKFNGIPLDYLSFMNQYQCLLYYESDNSWKYSQYLLTIITGHDIGASGRFE